MHTHTEAVESDLISRSLGYLAAGCHGRLRNAPRRTQSAETLLPSGSSSVPALNRHHNEVSLAHLSGGVENAWVAHFLASEMATILAAKLRLRNPKFQSEPHSATFGTRACT